MTALATVDGLIRVEEVAAAEFYVGELFTRAFGTAPPDAPSHLVALYRAAAACFIPLGYLHVGVRDDLCLCGGLAIDERAVRRMPAPHQAALRAGRNVPRRLVDAAAARFAHMPALWAVAGDPAVRETLEEAGFRPASSEPHLMVRWQGGIDTRAQEDLVRRVLALGAF